MLNAWFDPGQSESLFMLNTMGGLRSFTEGNAFLTSSADFRDAPKERKTVVNGAETVEITACPGYEIEGHFSAPAKNACVRGFHVIRNTGDSPVTVQHLSSAQLLIPAQGDDWFEEDRFRVWYCRSGWSQEGQWKSCSLPDLGLIPCREPESESVGRFLWRSEGSWSTGRYYPLVIVEDLKAGNAWFMEHEGGLTWQLSLGRWGDGGCLQLEADSADFHHDGFLLTLQPGESFTTTSAVFGKVEGGFGEAVASLTAFKRATNLQPWKGRPPVCYNVFMGGIFGEPTDRNLPPLIDACARAGVEVFCIDAGWYRPEGDRSHYNDMGDYVPDAHRFGEMGLEGILSLIREKGMIPGLWFEFEAANASMWAGEKPGRMLTRGGKVISPGRGFYDLCNPEVREHLFSAVERAYALGMRYIKNDYNYSTGLGIGPDSTGFNAEYRRRAEALESFIDELYRRMPDLIIENCGSGAQRADHGTLRHFHLQSTSDQERYWNYPYIAAGTLALMPPEKAGNWAYPYAVTDEQNMNMLKGGAVPENLLSSHTDGEITVFNLTTGFLGLMYLSGRLDLADEKNAALIREAVDAWKSRPDFVQTALPVFPLGFGYNGRRGFYCAGLTDGKILRLCVWKIRTEQEDCVIDLSRWVGSSADCTLLFPVADKGCSYALADGRLTVHMPGPQNMGRVFEINR